MGVNLQHLAGDRAMGPAELKDAEAVSLELPNSRGDTVSVTPALLLHAAQDGTAEPRGVEGSSGGAAAALQHLVPVRASATPTQGLEHRGRGAQEARTLPGRQGTAVRPRGYQAELALVPPRWS